MGESENKSLSLLQTHNYTREKRKHLNFCLKIIKRDLLIISGYVAENSFAFCLQAKSNVWAFNFIFVTQQKKSFYLHRFSRIVIIFQWKSVCVCVCVYASEYVYFLTEWYGNATS